MNEAQTKHDLIEPALRAAGWGTVEGSRLRLEFPITQGRLIGQSRRAQPLKADYVLEYKNRRIGIVEAKARDIYYTDGVGQAKDYAERLKIRYTYATNGLKIYGVDMEQGSEGDVSTFPTPDELWEMTFPTPKEEYKVEIANWTERLFAIPYEDRSGTWQPRYYQDNAITKVLEAIATKKDRILLTLATGTGKTAVSFQIAWKLFHASWNLKRDGQRKPRILFLADRNILADQAFNAFNAFDTIDENIKVRISPKEIKKKGKVPKNGSIFFTIFQTFMTSAQNGEDKEQDDETLGMAAEPEAKYDDKSFNFGQYPKDFFDFIVIDECHRGGANDESSWRAIMDYFSPAVQLGLTATPKRDVNGDTYKYFGDPVYEYALKEGINDGFLSPFRVKEIQTNYDEYTITEDDNIVEGEAEVGDTFTYKDYGRKIIIEQVERYRVQYFMDLLNQNQKTLVFCATQVHAAYIRDLINQIADSNNSNYCHRVTADDGSIGENHLRDFQDNEKSIPTVLTTSQKLSTGVDAPEIRNIVLLRPVESMVEFKQIVGRGTRLFDGKDYFTIFDFTKAHQHFKDPEWDGPPLEPEPSTGGGTRPQCNNCDQKPCICEKPEPELCSECGNDPCVCENPPKKMVTVKLSNGKALEIAATAKTTFWSPEGKPISASEFIKLLFGDLPSFFGSEEELRRLWSQPGTRKKLMTELEEKGYTSAQLDDLSALVHGENSDLYDVLNYVAYHKDLVPRLDRAESAKVQLSDYDPKQQEFLNFVLEQYVKEGVNELDDAKLTPLLILKYNAIADAKRELGDIKSIRETFVGFQEHLYQDVAG
ncbi:helicase, type I site-specific restriction-modification system restriction subunit [Owenweeksia hongkongensis DSM 17368]|uniref:Helicase, type I site-specific restriction-modification system restriction subunit n=1 Tax=Owenweeksia hongkongensis (strain DSM 17368 / CIP 108786 / JCM 12287 / NRRL B-23963 / UST20020801) TaxID=926562 RepID=G8R4C2_OWEHD|nr:type I restriction endonuclease subunit R [Owenweeksia hongkongensis]AEV34222.1 helicase, type I site-specific restriction-modification system restriction subunit [Owenweeksia hongkongensis DSM 17368]